jgi:hypothetical protein
MNGKFPYPFMNKLHPAAAYFGMLTISLAVLHIIFYGGALLSRASKRWLGKSEMFPVEADGLTDGDYQAPTNGKSARKAKKLL